jgi:GAF domain-containing protein/HAMP domain-containing protein
MIRSSLQTRLTILILAITAPLMAAIVVFVTDRAGQEIQNNAAQQLRSTHAAVRTSTDTWLDFNLKALSLLVNQPDIISMVPAQQKPVLTAMATTYKHMYLISTTDLKGINVARNDEAALTNYSDRLWFQGARDGITVTFQSLIGRTNNKPALVASMPIRDKTGKTVGVGMFASELAQLSKNLETFKFGGTGTIYIVDATNKIIAHSDPTRVTTAKNELVDASELAPVKLTRSSQQAINTIFPYTDNQGVRWRAEVDKTDFNWLIVVEQQEAELFSSLRLFQGIAWSALVIGLALLLALAWLTFRQAFQPINSLTNTVTAIAAGDLTRVAPVESKDEIGTLAAAFNTMTAQLRDLIGSLETRVQARTAQLRAGTEVARAASSILDRQELMQRTVDLICEQFGVYYAAIFLVDQDQRSIVLRAGRGEPGRIMLKNHHRFEMNSASMVSWVTANKQARIALDVGQDAVRFANPLLPNTRSEVALPLQAGERAIGVLDVQSERPAAFEEGDIAVLQSMADQIATTLENARLFSETQTSLAENERLVAQIQTSLQETTTLYQVGQAISTATDTASVFQAVVDHGLKPEIELCLLVMFQTFETRLPDELEVSQVWTRNVMTEFHRGDQFKLSEFPLQSVLSPDPGGVTRPRNRQDQDMWQHLPARLEAIACVPLTVGSRWIGALVLGADHAPALAPEALQRYRAMTGQAAVAIENYRLFQSAQANVQELSTLYRSVTRQAWQKTLETKPQLTVFEYAPTQPSNGQGTPLEMPLTLRGQQIGVLELTGTDHADWTEQERTLIEAIATQAALALDGARLFDETQRLAGRERLINEITARIRAANSVQGVLQTAARELAQAMNVPHAVARISPATESNTPGSDTGQPA